MISLYAIALILLLFWSAFFSGSEIALFSLSNTKIKTYQVSKESNKRLIASHLFQPRDLLVTIFMMNTLVNILLQNVASSMFGIESSWILKVVFPLTLTLILGEIIPKYIAMQKNALISEYVIRPIDFFTTWIRPVREWTVRVTTPISNLFFFFLKKEEPISDEEIDHVLEKSKLSGVLTEDEVHLIDGYMDLQDSQVRDVMRPREDVLFYEIGEPISKLLYLLVDEEITRLPVCDKDLDHVLGVIHANDFFLHAAEIESSTELIPLLKKPFFFPETAPAKLLLRRFEELKEKLALIVDEHRAVVGLASFEDLVEEVVGEITDLRDKEPLYEQLSGSVIVASGKLELEELNDIFQTQLESKYNMLTIGGWLEEQLGAIPAAGAKYETGQFLFQVLQADPNRVKRVYIRKKRRRSS